MTNLKIGTTEYIVEGPTPRYGTFHLTGPRGAEYITVQAYTDRTDIVKVITVSRSGQVRELRDRGNAVRLIVENGELREWAA